MKNFIINGVEDDSIFHEMEVAGGEIKRKVYDNRIVTFAPLYLSTLCVNNCLYCGFRTDNKDMTRRVASVDEIRKEVEVLAGKIGHGCNFTHTKLSRGADRSLPISPSTKPSRAAGCR